MGRCMKLPFKSVVNMPCSEFEMIPFIHELESKTLLRCPLNLSIEQDINVCNSSNGIDSRILV